MVWSVQELEMMAELLIHNLDRVKIFFLWSMSIERIISIPKKEM